MPQAPSRLSPRQTALLLRWDDPSHPLPLWTVRPTRPLALHPLAEPPPWLPSGTPDQPFDFTAHVRALCLDVVQRSPALSHIDVNRLLFAITQARTSRAHGLQARVTPLRFPGGKLHRERRGITYQVQRYCHNQSEFLYLVTFCLPRFLDQDFDCKLITIFHELYHISSACDGDLRRHQGRYTLHSHSQKDYDRHMAHLAREYLAGRPDPAVHAFCRLDFNQLSQRHGSVVGVVVPRPRIIPVSSVVSGQ